MKITSQQLKSFRLISICILLLGVALMLYMMFVESEPGALPLGLILLGVVGWILSKNKINKQTK